MSLAKTKILAKKLFVKVHNYSGIVTTNVIKKQYPKFRASNPEHWELLILKLLGRDRKANSVKKELTPFEQLKQVVSDLYNHGVYTGRYDFLMGVSCTFNHQDVLCGTIGYSEHHNSFYYSIGRNGINRYVKTLNQAVTGLFPRLGYQAA